MRIARLELKAFGPFTDRTLHLGPGLHIVHGPNEAGKSSTLRALKAWLFGFPERTHDNFLHANDQLLVGGCLHSEDGRELDFFRRKKRKGDILDLQGNPLGAEALAAFLPVADQAVFESLYGLSHEDLIRGGKEILAQEGEVGQALFSAGAGVSSLRGVLAGLEADSEDLFKSRGSRQEINEALAAYRETQRIMREASLSSRDWHEINNALVDAEKALHAVEAQRAQKDRRLRELERLLQLFPQLALRREIIRQLGEMGQVVVLPDDFPARRQALERNLHSLARREADLAAKLAQRETMAPVSSFQPVLDAEEAVEELQQSLGGYNKAKKDQPNLEGMRVSCKKEAAEYLRMVRQDIPLEQVETLRPLSGRRKVIAELATRHKELRQGIDQAEKELREIRREYAILDGELARLPVAQDTTELRRACLEARKVGAIDEELRKRAGLAEDKRRECSGALDRLSLWFGDLERFLTLRLPRIETVRKYEDLFLAYAEGQRDIRKDRERLQKRLATVEGDIRLLETSGSTPTEEELARVRARRDQGWDILRRQWLGGEELAAEAAAFAGNIPLAEAYEKKVSQADTVADRLRHEAERVQKFAALRTEQQMLSEELVALEQEAARRALAFAATESEWQTHWQACGIIPLSPKEMQGWLAEADTLRRYAEELQADERELRRKNSQRRELGSALARELAALAETGLPGAEELEPRLGQAEAVLARLTESGETRRKLLDTRASLLERAERTEAKIADLSQALLAWQREWRELTADLGGAREILPAEAGDLLDNLHSCFAKLKEAEEFRRRIDGIIRDNGQFVQAAHDLANRIAPESATLPAEEIVTRLKVLLNQARTDKTMRDSLLKKENQEEEEGRLLAGERSGLEHELAALCRLAGGIAPQDLAAAEKRSNQYRVLENRLAEAENFLFEGAGGLSPAELESKAATIDPDEIPGAIARLSQEIELELAPEGKRLSELIGEKRTRLRQMDGNAKAAEAAEEGARLLARIRRLAERYIQLKVAGFVLKSEIERFRSENQTPVLAITSRYFSQLTLGSFSGLLADENDQGDPVLAGMRPNGARVPVERMSSGTRDQLYLALRLASMEWRLAGHEPMPFILDDILVNADDARSRAALRILGELAARTQVIVFTHHRRIVDEARDIIPPAGLTIHELGA